MNQEIEQAARKHVIEKYGRGLEKEVPPTLYETSVADFIAGASYQSSNLSLREGEEESRIRKEIFKHLDSLPYAGGYPTGWEETLAKHLASSSPSSSSAASMREKILINALVKISEDNYPTTVFKPIDDDTWAKIVRYIQREYDIDQISGHYGRFFHRLHRDIANAALSEYRNTSPLDTEKQREEWISVETGLPKDMNEVLCCNKHGKQFVLWYQESCKRWVEQTDDYDNSHSWPITHWRKLPQPPNKSTESEYITDK